ncbi:MAG TPA: hypothetical protein VLF40_01150 [Candidatus Saccharimonadales bacterium]|nr:hypothetical protein [Candidatus Saccharimonadales bacterium]
MTRLPHPGGDDGQWGDILNAFLSVAHDSSGALLPGSVGATQLQTNAVVTDKIADANVTAAKLAGDIPKSALSASVQQSLDNADAAVAHTSGISRITGTITVSSLLPAVASTDYVYFCVNTITIMLPTAVGNSNLYTLKNTGAGAITVITSLSETIDGVSSATIPMANMSLSFISDGTNWQLV